MLLLAALLLLAGGALLNSGADRRDPLAESLFAVLDRDGLRAALGSLERRAAADSLALRNGHQLAHALGRRALTRSGGNAAVLGQCLPVFASGCYHGVVEALLQLRGQVDTPELEGMCAAVGGGEGRGPVLECAHGLGHGVLGALAMDIRATLGHCDALTLPGFTVACREGAFMEAITTATNG